MSDALLNSVLNFAIFFVVAGVFLEGAEYVEEVRAHGWQLRNLWKLAQKMGFAILMIGLVGEWYASTKLHDRDTEKISSLRGEARRLEHDNLSLKVEAKTAEGKIAEDNRIANKAANDAAKLGVTVSGLHDFVDGAVAQIKTDSADLENAKNQAAASLKSAQQILADMTSELNQERDLRQKYAKLIEPRQITDADVGRLAAKLAPFAGQMWTVTTFWDLKEPLAFANRLKAVLDRANWKYDDTGSKSMIVGGIAGVKIDIHPKATSKTWLAAVALRQVLTDAGFDASIERENDPNDVEKEHDRLGLTVGTKN